MPGVERTDHEAVEATLRTVADLNDVPITWRRVTAVRRMEPPLVSRVDRLRDRTGHSSPDS